MTREQDIAAGQDERAVTDGGRAARGTRRGLSRPARIATATAALLAAGGLLTACGGGEDDASAGHRAGKAAPAGSVQSEGSLGGGNDSDSGSGSSGGDTGGSTAGGGSTSGGGSTTGGGSTSGGESKTGTVSSRSGKDSAHYGSSSSEACTTSDLNAKIGPNHPGAGQENFALVLTNTSPGTCTLHGYPGFAFLNSDGDQVSVDPERNGDSGKTVRLTSGESAWAPLSFSNPGMTGVPTVTPDSALITPPDQRASLKVDWQGGAVSATGKASVPKIGALTPGTGA